MQMGEVFSMDFEEGKMPDVKGMAAMDALYLLENLGVEVELQGKGKVTKQSLQAGKLKRIKNVLNYPNEVVKAYCKGRSRSY